MSAQTQTIRISPGVRMWQVVVVAAAIVLSLLLGLLLGRSTVQIAPASAETTFGSQDFSGFACTGHVPNDACLQGAETGSHKSHVPPRAFSPAYLGSGHVPPEGYASADGER